MEAGKWGKYGVKMQLGVGTSRGRTQVVALTQPTGPGDSSGVSDYARRPTLSCVGKSVGYKGQGERRTWVARTLGKGFLFGARHHRDHPPAITCPLLSSTLLGGPHIGP